LFNDVIVDVYDLRFASLSNLSLVLC